MSLKKIKKALTMVLTASVALSAAGCGKDVAKNNMTEEKTVETTVQESSSETISDDTKTTETAQYAMERSETESTKETAREYSEVSLSNADGENWALRYFVAQIYLDLYKQTGSKEYLQKAYDIALNNVNVLVESQKELNLAYLSDIQEVSVNKEAEDEDREKKEVKQYNKLLKAQRKVELPPVDEALYLNCDLLFALAEQLDISVDEQKKIDAILHENGEPVFLTQALDEKFWFESADKKLDVQNIDIDFDGKTLKIPAVCIADRSRITVSVDGSSGNQTFQDWTVKKVYRPKGADCSDFIVIFTSETAKKYKYESGDKIAVQITPVAESADEILEYDYKATVIQKAFAFKTISFERAAK